MSDRLILASPPSWIEGPVAFDLNGWHPHNIAAFLHCGEVLEIYGFTGNLTP